MVLFALRIEASKGWSTDLLRTTRLSSENYLGNCEGAIGKTDDRGDRGAPFDVMIDR